MNDIFLETKTSKVKIHIGTDIFSRLNDIFNLKKYPQVVIITDQNLAKFWLNKLKNNLEDPVVYILPSGEKEKNIHRVSDIWEFLQQNKITRNDLIINLGGGVISDLGGFIASTYFRGISFLNIPTTLLSQTDASIGGKTGINFNNYKNSIGVFYQPIGIAIDPSFFSTLPDREFYSGLGEVIKYALIYDNELFNFLLSKNRLEIKEGENLFEIIKRSVKIKKEVVEKDELESGLRKILNFGHTAGHAIESLSLKTESPLFHGEAIGLGMLIEAKISRDFGILSDEDFLLIKDILKKYEFIEKIPLEFSIEEIINKISHDKKNSNDCVKWVLLSKIGETKIDQIVDEKIVRKVLTEFY